MNVTDEEIREVFLANGFTIKEGQSDLKPYVYAAARALLRRSRENVGRRVTGGMLPVQLARAVNALFLELPAPVAAAHDRVVREAVGEIRDALGSPKLEDIEQYRLQMAGITTAALGYWKEGDGIHPDYDTVPLRDVAKLYAKYDALHQATHRLDPVDGDLLPPIGTEVLIHLGRQDEWVKHTVVGYYVWGDLNGDKSLQRVNVRVRDAQGYLNARMLQDIRRLDGSSWLA